MKNLISKMNWELLDVFIASTQDGIQIADVTGKILFLNDASRNRLGVEDNFNNLYVSDFEPLFKNAEFWEEHLQMLRTSGVQVIRSKNINLITKEETPVEVTAQIQSHNGKEYVFAISREITELLEQETKLQLRENMLLAISQASAELLNNNNFFGATSKVLQIIGNAVCVDRTYLFTCSNDEHGNELVSQRCEWNSGEADPQIDNPELQNVPLNLFDDFIELMRNNRPFQSIVRDLPESSALREILQSQGIISILIIPVFHNKVFWGFIGYDECKFERIWDEVELSILKTLSSNMSAALERLDYNRQIENLAEFPLENPAPVLRIDRTGRLLFQNKMDQINAKTFSLLESKDEFSFDQFLHFIAADFANGQKVKYYEVQCGEDQYYSITAKEVRDKAYINLYFSNISKLIETEKKLEETRVIVDQVVNNMEDVIWSVSYPDLKGLYISPSTNKLYGIPPEEFYKNSQIWSEPILEEDKAIVDTIFQDIDTKGETDQVYRIRLKDGQIKWVRNRTKIVFDSEFGKPIRLDGYIVDITPQKIAQELSDKARQLAEESNLAKEEFIANMSHEIRTPLNAILGLSRQLSDKLEHTEDGSILRNIVLSGNHLQSLIENVLDFSKISAGQFELNFQRTNLLDEFNTVHNMLDAQAKEKGIQFKKVVDSSLELLVSIDKRSLKQILINILSNAIKFTDEGLVVMHVKLTNRLQHLEIQIKDTGIGMEPEFVEKIFEKFTQEDSSHERRAQGSGLGMAITKILIDLMGGEIEIKSVKGAGTDVRIVLPIDVVQDSQDSVNKLISYRSNDFLNKHILIAEDNEINALVAQNLLRKYGFSTSICKNGVEVIEHLKSSSYDLILMDVQMPIMGGILATTILRNELQLSIPVIGLSANALTSNKHECLLAGMNDYVTKPFEEDVLIETIVKHLKTERKPPKLYDLSKHFSFDAENQNYLNEIVLIFIKSAPNYIQEILTAYHANNFQEIRKIAHKLKPNLMMFGIESIIGDIEYLNHLQHDEEQLEKTGKIIMNLNKTISTVCNQLKEDLENGSLYE